MGFLGDATDFVIATTVPTVQVVLASLWVLALGSAVLGVAWAVIYAFLSLVLTDSSLGPTPGAGVSPKQKPDTRGSFDVLTDMERRLVRHWEKLTVRLIALDNEGLLGPAEATEAPEAAASSPEVEKKSAETPTPAATKQHPSTTAPVLADPAPTREAITTALKDIEDQLYAVRRMRAPFTGAQSAPARK